MNDLGIEACADRLWNLGMATKLDAKHRALVTAMIEKIVDDPEQAACLVAALVQLGGTVLIPTRY